MHNISSKTKFYQCIITFLLTIPKKTHRFIDSLHYYSSFFLCSPYSRPADKACPRGQRGKRPPAKTSLGCCDDGRSNNQVNNNNNNYNGITINNSNNQ